MGLFIVTKRWFITGTDTDVGKTVASCALLQAAALEGHRTAGYKPVASGSQMTADGLRNSDALALQANSTQVLSYAQVNPLVLQEATSPHIASVSEGQEIHLSVLSEGLRQLEQSADWILVEGAGGWFTPLSPQATFADWVQQEQLPVIMVVGIKLGCINHALLTALAIEQAGLTLAGWVANEVIPAGRRQSEYRATLTRMISAPLLGVIPHLTDLATNPTTERHDLGRYLDLNLLAVPR
ncbi:dithiobiotin synthetase [Yersinia kristensenii]|uniref:ATP-dependent dethiobiotin synthetase BioD n=1 Tax=Yersinia kristensenii TaxID=28152 RepID=A0A0T9KF97_YERKR|nr:dethiobiotin synthase [Yersinia kristensenii]CND95675.1 dithiobiotin synthetase [Yersinia kristensenii]CNE27235.1 dithiobiotin synthetase [Yersinia kristensenii]CNK79068.1 dithiobiotin synthetase [Yersinia kristensenii]